MSDTLPRLTRAVRAAGLKSHHLGREFVALGVLEAIVICRDGVHLHLEDGDCFVVAADEPLDYWLTPDDIDAPRRRAQAWHAENPRNGRDGARGTR